MMNHDQKHKSNHFGGDLISFSTCWRGGRLGETITSINKIGRGHEATRCAGCWNNNKYGF